MQQALQRLMAPMDCLAPAEVMLRRIEEVQMFFMSNTTEDRTLKELQLITYAIIKLMATGLYTKAIK